MLGQSLAIGMRALQIGARESSEEEEQLTSRADGGLARDRDGAVHRDLHPGPDLLFSWFQHRVGGGVLTNVLEGLFRVAIFVGVPLPDRPDEGDPPGVRVPRRRAQDDRGLRARRSARSRARGPVLDRARPLRHELPDHRDDHHGVRLHALRHARDLLADRVAPHRDPVDRRRSPTRHCAWGPGSRTPS